MLVVAWALDVQVLEHLDGDDDLVVLLHHHAHELSHHMLVIHHLTQLPEFADDIIDSDGTSHHTPVNTELGTMCQYITPMYGYNARPSSCSCSDHYGSSTTLSGCSSTYVLGEYIN
jgi:hypothetical protein